MEKMTNSINWFEIPVLNFDRAKEFYSRIYDFEMTESTMASVRMGFFPMDTGSQGVGGAIVQGNGYLPTSLGIKVYLNGGKDLLSVLNRVNAAGGDIIVPKTKISDKIGYFAVFEDTEGNHISLHSME
ncbi:MAG TPA: VOC family protein [Prolixibacteraceae bacterium]|nr:VOC family protein [Prolixibacteraceae bacterium]